MTEERNTSTASDIIVSILCIIFLTPALSRACSVFSLSTERAVVYGQNLDWHTPFPGQVVVNKRGIGKMILPWKGSWPAPADSGVVTWVSRYGSVTFTCYGRDFIEGGMNEAGLMIDETNLTAIYPPDDARPGVSCPQWMQYQLDNFAGVDEVLEHIDDLRPDGEGWHYLIADSSGACAVVEYLSGQPTIYTGNDIEICALTNTTYGQALTHIPLDAAFGGEIDIAAGSDSYGRFVRMAALLRDYVPERDGSAYDYAFHILEEVSCDETLRSVVYDSGLRRVLWTSQDNTSVRWLDLRTLDLSGDTPTQVLDVEVGGAGDVSSLLGDYTVEGNRALVTAVLGTAIDDSTVIAELGRRGLTLDSALEMIAKHPTGYCLKAK
jgi:choloylglycine hydrolase